MDKDLLIVGAGIAGLSAGCYAQMNGYRTTIVASHDIPGGLCTAWERKGYKFDVSMHMLSGSASGPFHRMWEELGITEKFGFHYHQRMGVVEGMGKRIDFSTDRNRLEQDLMAISPEDAPLIKAFVRLLFGPNMMKAVTLKPKEMRNIGDSIRMFFSILPLIRTFGKYGNQTIQEFAQRFRDPFLQHAIRFFIDSPGWPMEQFPMVAFAGFVQSGITEAGVPLGGSQQVVFHMADLFRELGGEIRYKSRVADLIIEKNRVAQRLYQLAADNPDSDFWSITDLPENPYLKGDGTVGYRPNVQDPCVGIGDRQPYPDSKDH